MAVGAGASVGIAVGAAITCVGSGTAGTAVASSSASPQAAKANSKTSKEIVVSVNTFIWCLLVV